MTKTKFVRSKAYIHNEYKPNILARFVDYLIKRNILGFNTVNQKVNWKHGEKENATKSIYLLQKTIPT